jgi:ribosomal-protein-alanine N-acetyltransferase
VIRSPRSPRAQHLHLRGRRVALRPLSDQDFTAWSEVRRRNAEWLIPWEPLRPAYMPDPATDRGAYVTRCRARERETIADHAYPFGIFVGDSFAGEINLNNIVRGALQTGTVGYWIDRAHAGNGYMSEALVVVAGFAFDRLDLHRLEVCIVPRNANSRRVVEKLGLRLEGTAERYLQIAGVWEDHRRYAITVEEWHERRDELLDRWVRPADDQ